MKSLNFYHATTLRPHVYSWLIGSCFIIGCAIAACAFITGMQFYSWRKLHAQYSTMHNELQVQHHIFAKKQQLLAEKNQIHTAQKMASKKVNQLQTIHTILHHMNVLCHDRYILQSITLGHKHFTLTIQGANPAAIMQYNTQLQACPHFGSIRIQSLTRMDDRYQATIEGTVQLTPRTHTLQRGPRSTDSKP